MPKRVIHTDRVHDWRLPYSQATVFGGLVFVAGQVADDPATHRVVEGGIKPQTRQALDNLQAILEEAGTSLSQVSKTTCFLTDRDDVGGFNEVYREYFPSQPPARSTFQVVKLAPGYVVEIEAIAALSD